MNNIRILGMVAGLLLLIANLNAQISLPSILRITWFCNREAKFRYGDGGIPQV